jgi:hypothetical protein
MELPSTGNQQPSGEAAAARSAPASVAPDIRGVGPVGVAFTDVEPSWWASLARALGPLQASTAPVAVELRTSEPVDRPARGAVELYPGTLAWREGAHLVVVDVASGLAASAAGPVVRLHQPAGRPDEAVVRRVLPLVLAQPLLARGAHLVHAGAFVAGGRAVLVIGPSGSGKSTTGAAARHAGHGLLADDVVVLWEEGGTWWVEGLPRPVQVPVEVAPGELGARDPDVRGRVAPDGWLVAGRAPVAGSVLPAHGTGDGHLGAVAPDEVARQLFGGSFAAAWPPASGRVLAMAAAVGGLPAWELGLAADPGRRLSLGAARLAELVAAL